MLILSIEVFSQNETIWTSPIQKCSEYKTEGMTINNLASDNDGKIYLPLENGILETIDLDGIKVWKSELGGEFITNLLTENNHIFAVNAYENDSQSTIRKIDKTTGTIKNEINIDKSEKIFVLQNEGHKYITSIEGLIYSFNQVDEIIWKVNLNTKITTKPIIFEKDLLFGTANKTLVLINKANGKIRSQINLPSIPYSISVNNAGFMYAGDQRGNIYSLNLKTEKSIWSAKAGGKIVDLDNFEDNIIVSSNDNYIYMLSEKKGDIIWKRKLAGRIIGKAIFDKNKAIFLTQGTNTTLIINLTNGKILNRIVLNADQYFVSKPLVIYDFIIIPTQLGISIFNPSC